MAVLLPPTPIGSPPGSDFWNDWYEKLRTLINNGAVSVTWANINFAGSNITSIANRAHNNLQSFQGGAAGEYFHLSSAQHAAVSGARITKGTDTTDDLIVDTSTRGLVLKSPNNRYWRVTVDNSGSLVTTDLGTSKP